MPNLSTKEKRYALFYIFGLTIFSIMGLNIVGPALPVMARDFAITTDAAWGIFSAFAIPGALVVLLIGVMADRFGRVQIIIPSLFFFMAGSIGCALAPTYDSLLFWRAVQGLGSGPLITLQNILVADVFEPAERPRVIGFVGVAFALSGALFPLLGGLLAEVNWRLAFWFSLLALPLFIYSFYIKLPYSGAKVSLVEYGKLCWGIISSKNAIVLFSLNFGMFFIFFGPIGTYFPIIMDYLYNTSPTMIGLVFLIGSLCSIPSALAAGYISENFTVRFVTTLGYMTLAFSVALIFIFDAAWLFFIPLILAGCAQNVMMPLITTRVSMLTGKEGMGAAMATNSLMFRVSQALSPAICAILWGVLGPYGPFIMSVAGAICLSVFAFFVFPAGKKVTEF